MTVPPLIVVVGPTASGKSALAMELAKKYDAEIICADSRTVYRHLNIGTAKPNAKDRQEVRHHLLDVVEPNQPFNAANFKQMALDAIADIASRGKLPILVGGTGLYIDAVIFNYTFGPPANTEERQKLLQLSVDELTTICREKNINLPENTQNKRHLIRALEMGGLKKRTKKSAV